MDSVEEKKCYKCKYCKAKIKIKREIKTIESKIKCCKCYDCIDKQDDKKNFIFQIKIMRRY
jgi:hypothetical protein